MSNLDLSTAFDITSWKETGQALQDRIFREVKAMSESLIAYDLPSKIQMTQVQYDDLLKLGRMPEVYQFENLFHDEQRIYYTPHNAMEVRVQNRTKLTYKEASKLDDKDFDKWEEKQGENDG